MESVADTRQVGWNTCRLFKDLNDQLKPQKQKGWVLGVERCFEMGGGLAKLITFHPAAVLLTYNSSSPWHCIASRDIASNDVTTTSPDPATDIKTSKHLTSKRKTSPPWNSRKLLHSKGMVWAHSIGKFFLCNIYFFLLKLPPPACPGTTCIYSTPNTLRFFWEGATRTTEEKIIIDYLPWQCQTLLYKY